MEKTTNIIVAVLLSCFSWIPPRSSLRTDEVRKSESYSSTMVFNNDIINHPNNREATNDRDADAIDEAAKRIKNARRVVALTGAGISVGSGVPAYRITTSSRRNNTNNDEFTINDGNNEKNTPPPLYDRRWLDYQSSFTSLIYFSPIGFLFFPKHAWYIYCTKLLLPILAAKPNSGHNALVTLDEYFKTRKKIEKDINYGDEYDKNKKFSGSNNNISSSSSLTILTQNVDGLHSIAGSTDVYELHGSVYHRHYNAWTGMPIHLPIRTPLEPRSSFAATFTNKRSDYIDPNVPPSRFARPSIVLFGESIPLGRWLMVEDIVNDLDSNDVMLVIGTSLCVMPAMTLPLVAQSNGCHIIEINPIPKTPQLIDRNLRGGGELTVLKRTAETILPKLVARITG